MKEFRKLRADEIEIRAAQVTEKGASLLLYKDARVDQRILDETVGSFDWKRSHQLVGDNLYCTVEIYDPEKKEWIAKQDVGTESFTEAEKGQASDSFKRACFNWGIGRELYSAPFIWVKATDVEIAKNAKGKFIIKSFEPKVSRIEYDDNGNISAIELSNKGKRIYSWSNALAPKTRKNDKDDDAIFDEIADTLSALDDGDSVNDYAKEVAKKYVLSSELKSRIAPLFAARRGELLKK